MEAFEYRANPGHVVFGQNTLGKLPAEADRLGLKRLLVISTPQQAETADQVKALLGARVAEVFTGARMHTPTDVTDEALAVVEASRIDGLVAIGGGSTIGLSKALAVRTDLPQLVVPTTYAGSEMTPILGETANGVKRTRTDPKILPEVVIYDINLTMSLPPGMSGTSGINAIAHAVEALYAQDSNPVTSLMALEAVKVLSKALPAIVQDPADVQARGEALYGAWLCGSCLGTVGMALHHKLCHTVGGMFDLPHSETHTILLPHALAYNAPAIPEVMASLRAVLGVRDPARHLFDLGRAVSAPAGLRDIGMPQDGIAKAVEGTLSNPYWNPRPLERDALTDLLSRAWQGLPPDPAA